MILLAWRLHPGYPLVVAGNRDEFHRRPSAAAAPWAEDPRVVAGRDLEAGGTWLGLRNDGRFAAVTNVREPGVAKGERSRGLLARDFLLGDAPPLAFAQGVEGSAYSGFNLLLADRDGLCYRSNRDGAPRLLAPGLYGVSNHLLDTPWPKLSSAKRRFAELLMPLDREGLFQVLADRERVADPLLPRTGVPLEWERLLSAVFVQSEDYGTRASTVLSLAADGGWSLEERSFDAAGRLVSSCSSGS